MKLYEIIEANDDLGLSLLYESLYPYLRSLYVYYKDYYCCEPVLMVTSVFNAAQYCKIVPSNDFDEALRDWIERDVPEFSEEEKEQEYELILFNSCMLIDCVNQKNQDYE